MKLLIEYWFPISVISALIIYMAYTWYMVGHPEVEEKLEKPDPDEEGQQ